MKKLNEPGQIASQGILLWSAFIFAFSLLLYIQTINHEYALDDEIVFVNKHVQKGVEGIPTLFSKGYAYGYNGINEGAYRPLTLALFAFEVEFFGNSTRVHHFINIFLYAGSCLLLFLFTAKILKEFPLMVAGCIVLLFAAHPVHTEVVANIKSRDEILCLFFLLSAALTFLSYTEGGSKLSLIASLSLFLLALLSKENAITFTIIFPLLLFYFHKQNIKDSLLKSLYFLVPAGIYLLLRNISLDSTDSKATEDLVNNSLAESKDLSQKLATISLIIGKYFKLLIFPDTLTYDYSYKEIVVTTWKNAKAVIPFIVSAALLAWALISLKKRSYYSFSILFFFISISIVLNLFVDIGANMAERFLFIPSIGFCLCLGLLLYFVSGKLSSPLLLLAATIIVAGLYSYKTFKRSQDWKNNLTLFEADVKVSPRSARTHYNLGIILDLEALKEHNEEKRFRMFERSAEEMEKALNIFPKYVETYPKLSRIYNYLGHKNDSLGNKEVATEQFNKAILYDPKNVEAIAGLGSLYAQQNDFKTAKAYLQKALALNPRILEANLNMGVYYFSQNQPDSGMYFIRRSLSIKETPEAYLNIGVAYLNKNNPDSAIYYIQRSLSLKKDHSNAHKNLGIALGNKGTVFHIKGNYRQAITFYRKGLEVNPNQPNLLNNLHIAYSALGQTDSSSYFRNQFELTQKK